MNATKVVAVWFWDRPCAELFSDTAGSEKQIHGVLTTDHAASSYGLPVVVADDGTVYGCGDIPGDGVLRDARADNTAEGGEMIRAARVAGYKINSPTHPE